MIPFARLLARLLMKHSLPHVMQKYSSNDQRAYLKFRSQVVVLFLSFFFRSPKKKASEKLFRQGNLFRFRSALRSIPRCWRLISLSGKLIRANNNKGRASFALYAAKATATVVSFS